MFAPHHHSGRILPHHHTSYAGLTFLLMLTAVFLAAFSVSSQADTRISSRIDGPPPTQGAVITSPSNGQQFSLNTILVSGQCPYQTYVSILRNNQFAGSVYCQADGSFSLQVSLMPGSNTLQAQDYDALDQPGPATPTVAVNYTPPTPPQPTPAPSPSQVPASPQPSPTPNPPQSSPTHPLPAPVASPTVTTTTPVTKGLTPGQPASWQVNIGDGLAPFTLHWDWGDGSADIYTLAANGPFSATHTYKKPGNYTILINIIDANGKSTFLTLAVQVNGAVIPTTGSTRRSDGSLLIAWPLWILAALMICSFWLGDKYKKAHQGQSLTIDH